MPKLILTLDTETGRVAYDNQSEEVFTVNGNTQAYMRGNETVITGWHIYVEMGKTPQSVELRRCGLGVIRWRDRQKMELARQLAAIAPYDEAETFGPEERARLEGAIEMADQILNEIGFVEE